MAKVKPASRKQKSSKSKRTPRAPRLNPALYNRALAMERAMQACSISNPFCPEAVNAKWPDNSYYKSVGWSVSGNISLLSTDAAGAAGRVFLPWNNSAAGTVAGTVLTLGAGTTAIAPFPAGVARIRVTSWGLILRSTLSRMTATGMVYVSLNTPATGASLATYDFGSVLTDKVLRIPMQRLIDRDVCVIPMPTGDEARLYRDGTVQGTALTLANFVNPGWQTVVIGVTGAPVSTSGVVTVETYFNYEFVPQEGESVAAFASPPPENSPAVRAASASVLETIGGAIEATASTVDRIAKSKAFNLFARGALAAYSRNPTPLLTYAPNVD